MGEEEILCVGRESVMCINPESTQVQSVKRSANPLTLWQRERGNKPLPKTGVCRLPPSVVFR